jgi:hypothetical protein
MKENDRVLLAQHPGRRPLYLVVIVPQKEEKMNIDDIIVDLKAEMQTLEDLKTQISEAQENIRETICQCQILKEGLT